MINPRTFYFLIGLAMAGIGALHLAGFPPPSLVTFIAMLAGAFLAFERTPGGP